MKLNFEIKDIKEHEDGSATLIVDMDDNTKKLLINYAINDIIKKSLVGDENAQQTFIME